MQYSFTAFQNLIFKSNGPHFANSEPPYIVRPQWLYVRRRHRPKPVEKHVGPPIGVVHNLWSPRVVAASDIPAVVHPKHVFDRHVDKFTVLHAPCQVVITCCAVSSRQTSSTRNGMDVCMVILGLLHTTISNLQSSAGIQTQEV